MSISNIKPAKGPLSPFLLILLSITLVASMFITAAPFQSKAYAAGELKPFPQQVNYSGIIKPNHVTQASMNASVAAYYTSWKSKYLKNNLSSLPGGYYVKGEITGEADGYIPLGSSEGQGYGMIISVLMAGYDQNAKTIYDGLFKTARAYKSSANSNLMGWVVADNTGAQGHFDSATDGDMDIAYSLILAHYQWGSTGTINYLAEANKMITNGIKVSNVTTNNRLNLGDWDSKSALNTRPSDWMLGHMRAFYDITGDQTWLNVINNLYTVYNQFSGSYSATTGLISDFVVGNPAQPAPMNYLDEFPETNEYNYNAARVPLRIVMDYALYGDVRGKTIADKIAVWIKGKTSNNPANIKDGYQLNGTVSGAASSAVGVFVSPFVASAVISSTHQAWVNSGWDWMKNHQLDYFSDSYTLLNMLFISGNWWKPVAGGTTPTPTPTATPTSTPTPTATPTATPAGVKFIVASGSVTASANDGNIPANTVDNNLTTRWSANGDGQSIKYDLGSNKNVSFVNIAFYTGSARTSTFDIQTSTDNVNFSTAKSNLTSSLTNSLQRFNLTTVTSARYIRIVGHGNSANTWNSYTEVEIWGDPATPSGAGIPGKIQAESYSAMNGIQTEATTDTGAGLNVGYTDTGDWMDYSVNVQTAGTYTVGFRVASISATSQLQLKNSAGTVLTTVNVPNTGGWQTWTEVSANVSLQAGNQTLRLYVSATGFNLNWLNFTVV